MAKISREGGPSWIDAQPGAVAEDANGWRSALHPDEQAAMPLHGEPDESAWLKPEDERHPRNERRELDDERRREGEPKEGEPGWPGTNSSQSTETPTNGNEKSATDGRQPARTTENPSEPDSTENSGARSTAGNTTASRGKTSK